MKMIVLHSPEFDGDDTALYNSLSFLVNYQQTLEEMMSKILLTHEQVVDQKEIDAFWRAHDAKERHDKLPLWRKLLKLFW